jgi:hypothetical protein
MAKLHGKNGKLMIGVTVIKITRWTGEHIKEAADVSDSGSSGAQQVIEGFERFNGSFDGFIDGTDLLTSWKPGTTGTLELYVSSALKYSFSAYIEANTPTMDVTQAVSFSATFKSNGAITQLA